MFNGSPTRVKKNGRLRRSRTDRAVGWCVGDSQMKKTEWKAMVGTAPLPTHRGASAGLGCALSAERATTTFLQSDGQQKLKREKLLATGRGKFGSVLPHLPSVAEDRSIRKRSKRWREGKWGAFMASMIPQVQSLEVGLA